MDHRWYCQINSHKRQTICKTEKAEYPALTINLKVFNKILKHSILDAKKSYYCEHFQKHKLDIKKT